MKNQEAVTTQKILKHRHRKEKLIGETPRQREDKETVCSATVCCTRVLIKFLLFLRRMAGPPLGSALPTRHSEQKTTRLKGVHQHAKLAGESSPAPTQTFCKNSAQKLLSTKSQNTHLLKETDADFGMTGTLGAENGKAVVGAERRLTCLTRGLRGRSSKVMDG